MKRVLNKLVQRPAILPLSQRNNIERSPGLCPLRWVWLLSPPPPTPSSNTLSLCLSSLQCCGSMIFWCGSGSCYFRHWPSRCQKKVNKIFSAYYFLKEHLHHFSKIKSQNESQNSRNNGFSYFFMMIEGSRSGSRVGSGSESIPLNSGYRTRIREAKKHVDPVDPDPQHCFSLCRIVQCIDWQDDF